MGDRAFFVLASDHFRTLAIEFIRNARPFSRVEIKGPRRTNDQNAKMWSMLGDISRQARHCDMNLTDDQWKVLFMQAAGREVQWLPSLYGDNVVPYFGERSSELSKQEMSDVIEQMYAYGAEHGVRWSDPKNRRDDVGYEPPGELVA